MKKIYRIFPVLVLGVYSLMSWAECDERIAVSKPFEKYTDFHNGIVLDKDTGLEWKKCSSGLTGESCENGVAIKVNWLSALDMARNDNFQGYTDWRLPNKKELASLVEKACFSPAINLAVFPDVEWDIYWTSSPYAASNDQAWIVEFNTGYSEPVLKAGTAYVRLVRAGY